MTRPLIPFVQNGYYASRNWIPLVKGNGFTTSGGGEQKEVWETASGSIVTFDAVAAPLRQLSVAVEPVQNLNGYDNPWPAGGGKNKLPYANPIEIYGVNFTVSSDGVVTLNGTSNSGLCDCYFVGGANAQYDYAPIQTGEYILSGAASQTTLYIVAEGGTIIAQVIGGQSATVTLDSSVKYRMFVRAANGQSFTNVKVYPMLRLSSVSDAAYSPYSNICPISGWTGVKVNRTGKNLLSSLPSPTGTIGWFCNPDGFLFKAGNTYCFSSANNIRANSYAIYASDKTTQLAYHADGQGNKLTYTPAADIIGYPRIYVSGGLTQAIIDTMQLEVGHARTEYESPTTATYSVAFPSDAGTVYGGTLDVVNGKMTVDRVGITPTIYRLQSINTYGIANFSFELSDASTKAAYQAKAICSALKYQTTLIADTTEPGFILSSASTGYLRIPQEIANTKETAQSWVSTNNVIVVFYLATPFELILTPEQISTLQGTNNVWSDAGDVTVEYRAQ